MIIMEEQNNRFNIKDSGNFFFNESPTDNTDNKVKENGDELKKEKYPSSYDDIAEVKHNDGVKKKPKKSAYKSQPDDAVGIASAVIIGLIYIAAAVTAVLCLTTDIISGLFGGIDAFEGEKAVAITQLYGYMIIALLPSALIFVANKAPIGMTTAIRVWLWIIGVLGMVGLTVLFFFISAKPEYKILGETAKDLFGISWQRAAAVIAAAGIIAVHLLGNLDPFFNSEDNKFIDFLEIVCDLIQGQVMFIIYTVLTFGLLIVPFIIIPIAGIVTFVLIVTLFLWLFSLSPN